MGVLEKTLESPLDNRKIKPVNPKRNQHWLFIRRTDTEALILWPHDAKNRLIGKDTDVGKDRRPKKKEQQRMRWLDSISNSTDMNLSKLQATVEDGGAWRATVQGVAKNQTRLSNWTTTVTQCSATVSGYLSISGWGSERTTGSSRVWTCCSQLPDLRSPGLTSGLQGWPHLEKSERWFPREKSGRLALGRQQRNFFSLCLLTQCVWAIAKNKVHWVF